MHATLATVAALPALRDVPTPAALVIEAAVERNIAAMIKRLGSGDRWRAHVKTAKAQSTIRLLIGAGVRTFKASTLPELATTLESGAADVLLAYPAHGMTLEGAGRIAEKFPDRRVSTLIDNPMALARWPGRQLGAFIDLDPGMRRTGISMDDHGAVLELAVALASAGIPFRGLHAYDGHLASRRPSDRDEEVRHVLGRVATIGQRLKDSGRSIDEIVLGGTHTFEPVLDDSGLRALSPIVRVGPGTIVYNDLTSLALLPPGFVEAAYLVISTVVSRPAPDRITCDAGLTAIQTDPGLPHCEAIGWPQLRPLRPSQEHLPFDVEGLSPELGSHLALLPRHVDTSIAQFEEIVVLHRDGSISTEAITARGH